ncbi:abortive infection family protein [Lichenihabitans sp. Uapishka_5]|uniref:abortive infection family protein n=1 Tax=Lichenihabitans sp. Uapishka_5 TaxID=3037302 RepID=UPI0029E812CC|nr:abortive infection family protein [Lichenihabitans sp. Uapishka_5]MDX7952133.1 abortive infection family protein [Lichenihabitans sp. Uapishka_5]
MPLLFSPFLMGALAEVITGGSGNDPTPPIGVYRSASRIEQFFLNCGVMMSIGGSSRVPAATEALRGIFSQEDEATLMRIIVAVCDPRGYLKEREKGPAVVARLNAALEPDGYEIMVINGKPRVAKRTATGAIVNAMAEKTALLDFDTVQRDIERAQKGLSDDPEVTVTAACSLIESVCRSILIELDLPLPLKKDIDGLIRAVQEPLGLSPGRTDLPPEIEGDVRQVLGGLTSVAKGIGALRTHAGTAHGREKGFRRVDPRIARLAVNAAGSIALFLIETWEQRQHRALPLREVA